MKEEYMLPGEIEQRSFELIGQELGGRKFPPEQEPIVKRVIHTTADFDYADNLVFSPGAVETALEALKKGAHIVTDTQMAMAGINKGALQKLGITAHCFMSDPDVAREAVKNGTTRAAASMRRAAELSGRLIFAVGNAPTALMELKKLIDGKIVCPVLVIGVPVGFVNVVESKELIVESDVPHIVARGRKGGSNVAAAVCNALLYMAGGR